MTSCSTVSFLANDLVKGLLVWVSTAIVSEGKSNLVPFLPLVLAEGISANSGASCGKNYLCGE
jgi:hypothetical protein